MDRPGACLRSKGTDPRDSAKVFTNSDGSVSHWYNVERPNVMMENGHVSYFTFAVSDVFKMGISGSSNNDTKVVVVPFDGVTFDLETGIGGADGSVGGCGGRDGSAAGSGGSSGGTGGAGGATTSLPGTGGSNTGTGGQSASASGATSGPAG